MKMEENNTARLAAEGFKIEMNARIYKNDPVINNVLLWVKVESGCFSGSMEMNVGSLALEEFLRQMRSMYVSLNGSARIEEAYGNHCFIEFTADKTGHIKVKGKLQVLLQGKLEFENSFDQTYLSGFINSLCDTDSWKEEE